MLVYNNMDAKYRLVKLDKDALLLLTHQLARNLKWMIAAGEITEDAILPIFVFRIHTPPHTNCFFARFQN